MYFLAVVAKLFCYCSCSKFRNMTQNKAKEAKRRGTATGTTAQAGWPDFSPRLETQVGPYATRNKCLTRINKDATRNKCLTSRNKLLSLLYADVVKMLKHRESTKTMDIAPGSILSSQTRAYTI